MRIIAGSRRGLRLSMHKGLETRPSADRVREAVFSSLQAHLPGARVLDLFAGSGAVGLEALSRGAASCVFVEVDRQALRTIEKNIAKTGFADQSRVLGMDFRQGLKALAGEAPFDLIYVDPPYTKGYYSDTLTLIEKYGIIADNGFLVCEIGKKTPFSAEANPYFQSMKHKHYGDTLVTYLQKRP